MDPITLLSAISATTSILGAITSTVKNLSDLKGKFDGADLTIRLLIAELSTVKSALIQIQDWAQYNSTDSPFEEDLANAFNVSLDGCKMAMDVLAEEVSYVVADYSQP